MRLKNYWMMGRWARSSGCSWKTAATSAHGCTTAPAAGVPAGQGRVAGAAQSGPAILDIWQWLFGMPTSIYAVIPLRKYNDFMVDDEATLLMEYPASSTATFILPPARAAHRAVGDRGHQGHRPLERIPSPCTPSPDTETYRRIADCTEAPAAYRDHRYRAVRAAGRAYPEMLANFADAILHGT